MVMKEIRGGIDPVPFSLECMKMISKVFLNFFPFDTHDTRSTKTLRSNKLIPSTTFRSSHGLPADVWGVGCMLYTLLVGRPPFDSNEVASTLNRVVAGHYTMPEHITSEAKDLLFRLLQKNPRDRIGIEEVLQHPFMIKYCGGQKPPSSYHTTDSGIGILTMSSGGGGLTGDSHGTGRCTQPNAILKRSRSEERFNPMPELKPIYAKNSPLAMMASSANDLQNCVAKGNRDNNALYQGVMQQLDKFQIHPPIARKPFNPLVLTQPYEAVSTSDHVLSGIVPSPKNSLLNHQAVTAVPATVVNSPDVPPLNTARLQPTRHRTKNAILTLCKSGEVVLEFVKYKPRFREDRIVDICRISSDGQRVLMFQPTVHGGAKVADDGPLEVPAMAAQEHFQYETLPAKHWKKYVYAARFVSLVQAKTPKVTYYSARAKCVLMESERDMDMHFYEHGDRITGSELRESSSGASGGQVKVVDGRSGESETITLGFGDPYMQLSGSGRQLFSHFVECLRHCRLIERTLNGLQQSGVGDKALFPVIIGRRPTGSSNAPTTTQVNSGRSENGTPRTPQLQMPSFAMSTVSAPNVMVRGEVHSGSPGIGVQDESNNQENQVNRVVVPGIGIATRFANGSVQVEYHDDTRMCVLAQSQGGGITWTEVSGMTRYYTPKDELPHLVRERLAGVPMIVKQLLKGAGANEEQLLGSGSGSAFGSYETPQRYASTGLQVAGPGKYGTTSTVTNMRLHLMR